MALPKNEIGPSCYFERACTGASIASVVPAPRSAIQASVCAVKHHVRQFARNNVIWRRPISGIAAELCGVSTAVYDGLNGVAGCATGSRTLFDPVHERNDS
jgi:hypothetical protein